MTPTQLEIGFGELFQFPATAPRKKRKRYQCGQFQCPIFGEVNQTLSYALALLDDQALELLRARLAWTRRACSAAIS